VVVAGDAHCPYRNALESENSGRSGQEAPGSREGGMHVIVTGLWDHGCWSPYIWGQAVLPNVYMGSGE
jgi:hypothetical protein